MALLGLAAHSGRTIHALTVNHGLRPDAQHEAQMVADWCAGHAIPHHVLTWQPPDSGSTLSDQARRARYGLMAEWCVSHQIPTLATAHHRDDQAETLLMRLHRGAGLLGLSGMDEQRTLVSASGDVMLIRPLLDCTKAELVSLCREAPLPFVEDPTNTNPAYDRARARAQLSQSRPLSDQLVSLQNGMAALWAELAAGIDRFLDQHCVRTSVGPLSIEASAYRALTPVMRRALLSHLCGAFNPGRHTPGRAAIAALDDHLWAGHGSHALAGLLWRTAPSKNRIWVGREPRAVQPITSLRANSAVIWDRQWRVKAEKAAVTLRPLGPHRPEHLIDLIEQTGVPKPFWPALGVVELAGHSYLIGKADKVDITPLWPQSAQKRPIAFF